MSNFLKQYHDPVKLIEQWWPHADIQHITYDPNMKSKDRQYWRIEQSGGDGTLLFTIEMLQKALIPLVNKTTCGMKAPKNATDIKYRIGRMRHATVYGSMALKCGGIHAGLLERVRVPVICEYIMESNNED